MQYALEPNNPDWPNPSWSTLLLRKLVTNESFKNRFINTFADHINTSFNPNSVIPVLNEFSSNIDEEMQSHVQRWGGSYQNWINRVNDMSYFANQRPVIMRNHIQSTFGLDGKHILTLNISDDGAGIIRLNTLLLHDFPWSGIYFHDVPVEITAVPSPGHIFTGWSGNVSSTDPLITVNLDNAFTITANFQTDPNPVPTRVIINEICFAPDSSNSTGDWIELHNISDQYVDLSDWIVSDGDNRHTYEIKKGTILEPHGYQVICRKKYEFAEIHPEVENYEGNLGFGLSSLGDVVRLFTSETELVNLVSYGVNTPWPMIMPGSGYTLSLLSPELDNFMASSWAVSEQKNGTPGRKNFGDPVNTVPEDIEETHILLNCLPNPFSTSTTIMFYSGNYQPVRLSAYDINGRLIDVLFDADIEKGYHEVIWTPQISEGIYILRMDTPEHAQTIRMIKVR